MADTRSKYIPPGSCLCLLSRREGGRGKGEKMQVRATIEGNKVSIVQTRSEGAEGGGERGKKKARSRRNTMDGLDGSLVRCFIYADRGGRRISRSKFSWFVKDAMFPTTLSIVFDRFSFSIVYIGENCLTFSHEMRLFRGTIQGGGNNRSWRINKKLLWQIEPILGISIDRY